MKFRPKKTEDTRNFLKLKDGESLTGVFRGDLFEYRLHWADNHGSVCPGKDTCTLCATGNKAKFRFRVNFLVKEGSSYVAKIMEQGWTVYELLREMNETDYDLEKYVMKITRRGEKLDTTYSIIPAPNGALSEETEAKLKLVPLNDLGHLAQIDEEPHVGDEPPPLSDVDLGDIPF